MSIPGGLFRYVIGALEYLAKDNNWEGFGDMTPAETAEYFLDVIDNFQEEDCMIVGEIRAFCRPSAIPSRWLELAGQTIAQADYQALSSVVPDGWLSGTDIVLPNTRGGFSLVGAGNQTGYPNIVTGAMGGELSHALTESEIPAHTHVASVSDVTGLYVAPGEAPGVTATIKAPSSITGGGQSHNNMPPYLAIRWAIYAGA